MESKNLKILCLHGRGQNMDVFRQKTGQFRKRLKQYADFVFINSPHQLISESNADNGITDERVWCFKSSDKQFNAKDPANDNYGIEKSLNYLESVLDKNGPFDGILGFSEGALLLAVACTLRKSFYDQIKFLILIAGCKSRDHMDFYLPEKFKIPSLHIIGETDRVITPDRSKDLAEVFENPEIVFHPGGHFVPSSRELNNLYIQFLEKFMHK